MSVTWTTEQIMALAPDEASAKAGRGLAVASKWASLGRDEVEGASGQGRAVWGECKGSGASPYQVQIDLSEPAFRCTCPSRKFPCKHGIGLFLLYASGGKTVPVANFPAWVTEWLSKRQATAEKKEQKKEERTATDPNSADPTTEVQRAKAAADQAKRAASRHSKVTQGLQDLDLWLCDLLRQGFAALPARSPQCWDEQAARMVDAQAPGVARLLREMGGIPNSGEGWMDRLLERIGLLHLLLEGYEHIESPHLTEANRADIRDAIGWNVRQEEVYATPGLIDRWLTVGQRVYVEEQFRVHRNWLQGERTGRCALLLDFVRQGQAPVYSCIPGTGFEAELAFYPGAYPLRALIKEQLSDLTSFQTLPGHPDAAALLSAYADALAANPWLDPFPATLVDAIPVSIPTPQTTLWAMRDTTGHLVPLRPAFTQTWRLLGISGGHPITLFGEWDGSSLLPLGAWAERRYIRF